ncbi:hypothetical protein BDV93DRAFT_564461, partial [Ceratobasidium sp. AG-I]
GHSAPLAPSSRPQSTAPVARPTPNGVRAVAPSVRSATPSVRSATPSVRSAAPSVRSAAPALRPALPVRSAPPVRSDPPRSAAASVRPAGPTSRPIPPTATSKAPVARPAAVGSRPVDPKRQILSNPRLGAPQDVSAPPRAPSVLPSRQVDPRTAGARTTSTIPAPRPKNATPTHPPGPKPAMSNQPSAVRPTRPNTPATRLAIPTASASNIVSTPNKKDQRERGYGATAHTYLGSHPTLQQPTPKATMADCAQQSRTQRTYQDETYGLDNNETYNPGNDETYVQDDEEAYDLVDVEVEYLGEEYQVKIEDEGQEVLLVDNEDDEIYVLSSPRLAYEDGEYEQNDFEVPPRVDRRAAAEALEELGGAVQLLQSRHEESVKQAERMDERVGSIETTIGQQSAQLNRMENQQKTQLNRMEQMLLQSIERQLNQPPPPLPNALPPPPPAIEPAQPSDAESPKPKKRKRTKKAKAKEVQRVLSMEEEVEKSAGESAVDVLEDLPEGLRKELFSFTLEMACVIMGVKNTREVLDPILPEGDVDSTDMEFWCNPLGDDDVRMRPRLDLSFDTQLNVPNPWVPYLIDMCRTSKSTKIVDVSMFDDITDEQYTAAFKLGWFKSMRKQYLARVQAESRGDPRGAKLEAKQKRQARKMRRTAERSENHQKNALEAVPSLLTGPVGSKNVEIDKKWIALFNKRLMSPMSSVHGDDNDDAWSGYRVTQDGYRDDWTTYQLVMRRVHWLMGALDTYHHSQTGRNPTMERGSWPEPNSALPLPTGMKDKIPGCYFHKTWKEDNPEKYERARKWVDESVDEPPDIAAFIKLYPPADWRDMSDYKRYPPKVDSDEESEGEGGEAPGQATGTKDMEDGVMEQEGHVDLVAQEDARPVDELDGEQGERLDYGSLMGRDVEDVPGDGKLHAEVIYLAGQPGPERDHELVFDPEILKDPANQRLYRLEGNIMRSPPPLQSTEPGPSNIGTNNEDNGPEGAGGPEDEPAEIPKKRKGRPPGVKNGQGRTAAQKREAGKQAKRGAVVLD